MRRRINTDTAILASPSNHYHDDLRFYDELMTCADPDLAEKISSSLGVLADALRLYGTTACIASFNGGKDADVVLHLFRAAFAKHYQRHAPDETVPPARPRIVYFYDPREFSAVADHVHSTVDRHALNMTVFDCKFVDGLDRLLREEGGRSFAFVLGTRKGDPNCGDQESFAPSSSYFPPFMRVNPILRWDYALVWRFMRAFRLPYCPLYDQGYTSLGRQDDTLPNPALARPHGGYYPAYLLADGAQERAGRKPSERRASGSGAPTTTAAAAAAAAAAPAPASAGCSGGPAGAEDSESWVARVRGARTAGIVTIGDEVLKGEVEDANTGHALRRLRSRGISVRRVATVPDRAEDIAEELALHMRRYDLVISSGGVGPTHDDVTLRAAALATGRALEVHPDMSRRLLHLLKLPPGATLSPAQTRLATFPAGSILRDAPGGEAGGWPILQCQNLFVLPGVPKFFRAKLDVIVEHFVEGREVWTRRVSLQASEEDLLDAMAAVMEAFPGLTVGSYPQDTQTGSKLTVVTLEAQAPETSPAAAAAAAAAAQLEAAAALLLARAPPAAAAAAALQARVSDGPSPFGDDGGEEAAAGGGLSRL